jgi:hypothetical protein
MRMNVEKVRKRSKARLIHILQLIAYSSAFQCHSFPTFNCSHLTLNPINSNIKLFELDDRAERTKLVHSRSNSTDYLNIAGNIVLVRCVGCYGAW